MSFSSPGVYRYGSPRVIGEGWRIGVARLVPRGIRREDRAKLGHFDLWLPLLAPSAELVKTYLHDEVSWEVFSRRYRSEMKRPECRQVIDLLAMFSRTTAFCVGCFCEDETRCHRSILQPLIVKRREALPVANLPSNPASIIRLASPVCYANWDEDDSLT